MDPAAAAAVGPSAVAAAAAWPWLQRWLASGLTWWPRRRRRRRKSDSRRPTAVVWSRCGRAPRSRASPGCGPGWPPGPRAPAASGPPPAPPGPATWPAPGSLAPAPRFVGAPAGSPPPGPAWQHRKNSTNIWIWSVVTLDPVGSWYGILFLGSGSGKDETAQNNYEFINYWFTSNWTKRSVYCYFKVILDCWFFFLIVYKVQYFSNLLKITGVGSGSGLDHFSFTTLLICPYRKLDRKQERVMYSGAYSTVVPVMEYHKQ